MYIPMVAKDRPMTRTMKGMSTWEKFIFSYIKKHLHTVANYTDGNLDYREKFPS